MQTISRQDVLDFLQKQYLMQLATANKDGVPHVSVMLFAVDEELNFYCATNSDSNKAKNILENNRVSLVVWEQQKMLVQVLGSVEIVKEKEDLEQAYDLLGEAAASDNSFWPPLLQIEGRSYSVYKIQPIRLSALNLSSKHIREHDSPFTQII